MIRSRWDQYEAGGPFIFTLRGIQEELKRIKAENPFHTEDGDETAFLFRTAMRNVLQRFHEKKWIRLTRGGNSFSMTRGQVERLRKFLENAWFRQWGVKPVFCFSFRVGSSWGRSSESWRASESEPRLRVNGEAALKENAKKGLTVVLGWLSQSKCYS